MSIPTEQELFNEDLVKLDRLDGQVVADLKNLWRDRTENNFKILCKHQAELMVFSRAAIERLGHESIKWSREWKCNAQRIKQLDGRMILARKELFGLGDTDAKILQALKELDGTAEGERRRMGSSSSSNTDTGGKRKRAEGGDGVKQPKTGQY